MDVTQPIMYAIHVLFLIKQNLMAAPSTFFLRIIILELELTKLNTKIVYKTNVVICYENKNQFI